MLWEHICEYCAELSTEDVLNDSSGLDWKYRFIVSHFFALKLDYLYVRKTVLW